LLPFIIALAPGSLTDSIYEISGWKPSETFVYPYLKVSTSIEVGYKDFSSITNWYVYGDKTERDYKFIRDRIIELFQSIGWTNLTLEEKQICSQYFAVPKSNRNEIYTIEEQIELGSTYNRNSIESRKLRSGKASVEIRNRLIKSESNEILDDVFNVSSNMFNTYIENGREGTIEGDPEGLFDYIESRIGTSFEGIGFKNKN